MLRKKIFIALALGMVFLLVAVSVQAARPNPAKETVSWRLSGASIVDPGQTVELPADEQVGFPGGILTTGYTIEAKASSNHGNIIPEGTFRLTLSAFTPNQDMEGQPAGAWYIEGNWTIVDKNASKDALKARHNPFTFEGKVRAELPFNPALEKNAWSAKAFVPMSLTAGQWTQGKEGILTLDSKNEGDLTLNIELRPKSR